MSILTPEAFSTYGGLDADAGEQGDPYSAHVLRTIAKGSNRLLVRPYPLFNLIWPVVNPDEDRPAIHNGYSSSAYEPLVTPIPISKKVATRFGEARIRAKVPSGKDVQIKVETLANRDYNDIANVTLTANGSFANNTLSNIPLRGESTELVRFYLHSNDVSTDALVPGTYGGVASGTADAIGLNFLRDDAADWNMASDVGATMAGKHVVRFLDSNSNALTSDRLITVVVPTAGSTAGNSFVFDPPLTHLESIAVRNSCEVGGYDSGEYQIKLLYEIEIAQLAMRAEAVTL